MKAVKNIFFTLAAVFALFALASCQNAASGSSSVEDVFAGTTWKTGTSAYATSIEFASSGSTVSIKTAGVTAGTYDYSVSESNGAYTATATASGVEAFTLTVSSKDATSASYTAGGVTSTVTKE